MAIRAPDGAKKNKHRCEQRRDSTWQTRTCVSMMEVTRLKKKMDGKKKTRLWNLGFFIDQDVIHYISSNLNVFTEKNTSQHDGGHAA